MIIAFSKQRIMIGSDREFNESVTNTVSINVTLVQSTNIDQCELGKE
jgi:hypothetical protein